MRRLVVKAIIDPPNYDHCLDPKSNRRFGHCKFLNWMPSRRGCDYSCDIYRRRLHKRKDGTIRRPRFCSDQETGE